LALAPGDPSLLYLAPGDPSLLYLQATLDHRSGRLDAARDHLEDMLSKEPPPEYRGEALLELGEVLGKLDKADAAFRAITEGNALRAQSPAAKSADGDRFLARVATARAGFTQERIRDMAAKAPACERPAPVFFVGFPRSGTTLMERALKAHPEIVTTDERSPLTPILTELSKNKAYPENLDRLTGEDVKQLQDRFWAEAEATLGPLDGRLLVDKMPLNIVNLGLANGLFPEARVLVALRDPRDTCLSCFMQRFQFSDAMVNFLDLERTAETYGAVMGLWLQYRDALSAGVHRPALERGPPGLPRTRERPSHHDAELPPGDPRDRRERNRALAPLPGRARAPTPGARALRRGIRLPGRLS
jgi:hypothetical protein